MLPVRPIRRWRRRRNERRIALRLISEAVVQIRTCAFSREVCPDRDAALEHIRMLADTIHNLPGVFDRGTEPHGWPGPGHYAFYYLWTTASPIQKEWLASTFSENGYDYSYLDRMDRWPAYTEPATHLSVRRGSWRVPWEPSSVKVIDTATYAALLTEEFEGGLSPKRPDLLIAHLDPDATHVLMPRRPDDNFFGPKQDGVWEYRALIRMYDGELIVDGLRARTERIRAVPAGVSQREQVRLASLPVGRDRDTYLWLRDHRVSRPDCPLC